MIDITIQFLLQVINILPALIPLILILNICSELLWGK